MNERIIEVASKLFLERGIRAVSMDDIAQTLGISKRTLYETFSSKDELLVSCLEDMHRQNNEAHKIIDQSSDDILEIFVAHLFLTIKQIKSVSLAFLQDCAKMNKASFVKKFSEAKKQNRLYLCEKIKRGQELGIIRADINVDITLGVFTEQQEVIKEIYATGLYTMEEIFMTIFVMYLRGMCTPKGVEKIDHMIEKYKKNN